MIYLCIPAHNEEQTVGVVLWKIRQIMAELQRDYQLLVADDASTDSTQDVLEPYTRVLPLTVMRSADRRGYAASLEMLLREAVARSDYPKRDIIITLQADFTDEPGHVGTLVKRIESGADIVTSNMLAQPSAPRLLRWRRPALNALVRRLGWPNEVRDPLNGFAAYRVICIRRAIEERKGGRLLRHEGWSANAELLHCAVPHARRVDVVDQHPHPERLQRVSRFRFVAALKQVLGLRRGRVSAGQLEVGQLQPSSVVGGPSSQRSLVAESLRNGVTVAEEKPRRRSGNGGQKRPRPAAERRGVSPDRGTKAVRGPRKSEASRTARKPRAAPAGSTTAGAAAAAAEDPGRPEAAAAADGQESRGGETLASPRKRPRRGRRGGGRSRKPAERAGEPSEMTGGGPAAEAETAPQVVDDAASAKMAAERGFDAGKGEAPAGYEAAVTEGRVGNVTAEASKGYEVSEGHGSVGNAAAEASNGHDAAVAEGANGPARRRRSNRRGGRGRHRRSASQPRNGEAATEAGQGSDDTSVGGGSESESTPQPRAS